MVDISPNLVTRTEFAKKCGVTAMAITNAVRDDRVEIDKESNKVDLNNEKNQKYQSSNNHQRKGGERKSDKVDDTDLLNTPLHELNEDQLKRRRLITQIEEKQQKNAKDRGELVDRELIEKFFRELEAIDKKQLRNVAKRSTPEILSALEVDESKMGQIEVIIDAEIWKVIAQKKDKMESFLISLESDDS